MDTNSLIDPILVPLLLKSCGFLALAFLLWPLARTQSAAFQAFYWRGAMAGLLVLGVFSLWVPIFSVDWFSQPEKETSSAPATLAAPAGDPEWRNLVSGSDDPFHTESLPPVETTPPAVVEKSGTVNWLRPAWLSGVGVLVALWLLAQIRLKILRKQGSYPDHWHKLLGECRTAIGMRPRVRLVFDDKVEMPCAWGVIKPTVMLPASADSWDEDRQRMVLMHELSHLKRRDPVHDLIGRFCVALFWMNPLVWFAWKQVRLSAERATDDAVLATGCDAKPYATLLLAFVKEGLAGSRSAIATTAPMAQRSTVGVRVEKILDPSQRRANPPLRLVGSVLVLALATAAFVGGLQNAPAQEDGIPVGKRAEAERTDDIKDAREFIREKLQKTIIPEIRLTEATLREAVEVLRTASVENDNTTDDPKQKGVNIIVKIVDEEDRPAGFDDPKINLHLSDVPMIDALKFTTELAGYRFEIHPLAVIIAPKWAKETLYTQTFRVDRNVFHEIMTGGNPDGTKAKNIKDALLELGIDFPEGASATFIPATSELIVRLTQSNMDLVQVLLDSLAFDTGNKNIHLRLEIYSLPTTDALELIERYRDEEDASGAVAELRKAGKKKAKLIAAPSLIAQSGQRSKVGSGEEYPYIAGYEEKDGKDSPMRRRVFFGTLWEIEPVMDPANHIQFHVSLTKTFGEPTIEKSKAKAPVSGDDLPIERVRVDQGVIQTQGQMSDGQTKLLGSLSPSRGETDQTLLVFLNAKLKLVK